MLETRLIGADDLVAILDTIGRDRLLDELIDDLRAAFERHEPESVVTRRRDGYHYTKPDLGLVEWMPVMDTGRSVVIKMVGYHPTNPIQRNLPSVLATTSMWDTGTGHLVAISEATLLTALRTGAASALATEVLAIDDPLTIGVVGCGAQAVTQLHALSRVRTIDRVIAFDTEPTVAATLASRIAFLGVDVETIDGPALPSMLARSDVLCTCTSVDIGAGPVIPDEPHQPWLHINAVGADFPGKVELPTPLVERAFVVPDVLEQCRIEGECQPLDDHVVGPELYELLRDRSAHAHRRDELTVFDSTGWSLEDQVALELVLRHADALRLGTSIALEAIPTDPYDPYSVRS